MQPDADDEYFLGGGDDSGRDDDSSPRKGALIGLAVVVVLVAVAITLTSLLVDTTSSAAAASPRSAAQRWGDALVHGRTATRRRLECAAGSPTGDVLRLVITDGTKLSVGRARQAAERRWSVPLEIDAPDGSPEDSVSITVVRESGRYLVC